MACTGIILSLLFTELHSNISCALLGTNLSGAVLTSDISSCNFRLTVMPRAAALAPLNVVSGANKGDNLCKENPL
jgi:hypothetical protein